jgi:hypothetical protein
MNASLLVFVASIALAVAAAWAAPAPNRNGDESKVGTYTLPELLLTEDGRRVADVFLWRNVRRGELLRAFATNMYGRTPAIPVKLRAETIATKRAAVDGLATRTLVTLRLFDDPAASKITLMLYVPNAARGPAPVFLGLNYYGVASVEPDPSLPLTDQWMRPAPDMGIVNNRQTEATRDRVRPFAPRQNRALGRRAGRTFRRDHLQQQRQGWRGPRPSQLRRDHGRLGARASLLVLRKLPQLRGPRCGAPHRSAHVARIGRPASALCGQRDA